MSPLVAGVLEIIDEPLFDTLYTRAPRVMLRDRESMFVNPLGSQMLTNEGSRLKDQLDTNMQICSALPAPNRFRVEAIRAAFVGRKILPVSSRYYADTLIRFILYGKTYWAGPAWKCADPVTMVLNPDTLLVMGSHKRVDLVKALRRKFNPSPAVIESQMPFHVEVTFAGNSWREYADDAPERLVVVLEGQYARATQ